MKTHPNTLTIAGFDPSGGAGITADTKTFEALKCYGFAVCTANTIQHDTDFKKCYWIDSEIIKSQITILVEKFRIDYVKIGIIQNWKILLEIINFLLEQNNNIKIVLDPILRSTSLHDFHTTSEIKDFQNDKSEQYFDQILDKIYVLTPNYQEINRLYPNLTIEETMKYICSKTNLFLKGGHRKEAIGKDQLYTKNGAQYTLNSKMKNISEKHGSGCVLSSAITAQLAQGFPLLKACFRAKRYTEKVLSSNRSLLGYHSI